MVEVRRRTCFGFALGALLALASGSGCQPGEHAVLIEAVSEAYVETLRVTIVDIESRRRPPPREYVVGRVPEQDNPMRVAIELDGPRRLLVHLVEVNPPQPERQVGIVSSVQAAVALVGEWLEAFAAADPPADGRPAPCVAPPSEQEARMRRLLATALVALFALAVLHAPASAGTGKPSIQQFLKIRTPAGPSLLPDGSMLIRDWPDGVWQLYRAVPKNATTPSSVLKR